MTNESMKAYIDPSVIRAGFTRVIGWMEREKRDVLPVHDNVERKMHLFEAPSGGGIGCCRGRGIDDGAKG